VTETNVFQLSQPGTFADPLTEVLRNGARSLLSQAVEAEVAALISCHIANSPMTAASAWCGTGICPSARS
jgi:hypothetical protein